MKTKRPKTGLVQTDAQQWASRRFLIEQLNHYNNLIDQDQAVVMKPSEIEALWVRRYLEAETRAGRTGGYADILTNLYDDLDNEVGFTSLSDRIGFDHRGYDKNVRHLPENRRKAHLAEELIAHMAEKDLLTSELGKAVEQIFRQFLTALREFLSMIGLKNMAERAGDQQRMTSARAINNLISDMHDHFGLTRPKASQTAIPAGTPEQARLHIKKLIESWPQSIRDRIIICTNNTEVPAHIRAMGRSSGAFDPNSGNLYLMAHNVKSKFGIEKALWHECTHLALHEATDPKHPVGLFVRAYQRARGTIGSDMLGHIIGLQEGQREEYKKVNEVACEFTLPDHIIASIGAFVIDALYQSDPAQIPTSALGPTARTLELHAKDLTQMGLPNIGHAYHVRALQFGAIERSRLAQQDDLIHTAMSARKPSLTTH